MAGMFASPFAIRQPGDTLAQGGWPSVLPPNPVPGAFPPAPNPAPAPSPSFFGDGGTGRNIAGAIGDFLLQQAHAQPIFAPMQQQRTMMARQAAQAQRQQQAEYERQKAMYDYKLANPEPISPHFWETNDGSLAAIGGNYGTDPKVLYKDPTPKVQWYETTDAATGAKKLTPVWPGMQSQGGMGGSLPPGYTVRGTGTTPAAAGPILSGAASSNTISRSQADQIRSSLGPNGQAAFAQWLAQHNITVGNQ